MAGGPGAAGLEVTCGGGVCHVFVANAGTDEVLRVTLEGSRPGAKRRSRSEWEACMGN